MSSVKGKTIDDEMRNKMEKLRSENVSMNKIAKQLGCATSTVFLYLSEKSYLNQSRAKRSRPSQSLGKQPLANLSWTSQSQGKQPLASQSRGKQPLSNQSWASQSREKQPPANQSRAKRSRGCKSRDSELR